MSALRPCRKFRISPLRQILPPLPKEVQSVWLRSVYETLHKRILVKHSLEKIVVCSRIVYPIRNEN